MNPDDFALGSIPEGHRSGYVALVGKPNAGKSTLMNALVGRKLSIVSDRPQTTRHRILGILTGDDYQALFLDTPGVIRPRYRLQESMMRSLSSAVVEADLQVLLVDASRRDMDEKLLEVLTDRPCILALNKMDLVEQQEALPIVAFYTERRSFV
ncbi:MAG TPA: GTPase Era, partial [Rhodothermales bacterium]